VGFVSEKKSKGMRERERERGFYSSWAIIKWKLFLSEAKLRRVNMSLRCKCCIQIHVFWVAFSKNAFFPPFVTFSSD